MTLSVGDPRLDAVAFGALGPAAIGFTATLAAYLIVRASARKADPSSAPSRAGIGPALGVGLAFVLASLGLDGVPERMPVGSADWVLPVMATALLAAVGGELLAKGRKAIAVRWLLRVAVIGVIVAGPLSLPIKNRWEGGETVAWVGGIALWMLLAFAASDRTASRSSPPSSVLVWHALIGGLVPVIFGAGVTAQSQIAGGVAAGLGGVLVAAWLGRKALPPMRAVGGVVVPYIAMLLLVSWQFVSDLAWWEFGVIAATPLAIALIDLVPVVRKLSAFKRFVGRMLLVIAATAAVSGHHVPALVGELTGSSSSSEDAYWESLG
ncbi:MAG: hypothetical protein AAFR96_00190 [Planctomycetota bacterium]